MLHGKCRTSMSNDEMKQYRKNEYERYGRVVKEGREQINLSQDILATGIGISRSELARIESGDIDASASLLSLISLACGFPPTRYFQEDVDRCIDIYDEAFKLAYSEFKKRQQAQSDATPDKEKVRVITEYMDGHQEIQDISKPTMSYLMPSCSRPKTESLREHISREIAGNSDKIDVLLAMESILPVMYSCRKNKNIRQMLRGMIAYITPDLDKEDYREYAEELKHQP